MEVICVSERCAIPKTVKEVGRVLSTVLYVDVVIADEHSKRVAVTGRYKDEVDRFIAPDFVFTQVLMEKEHISVTERKLSVHCRGCSARGDCEEVGNICCAITVDGRTISGEARKVLHWPGKVRELENETEYAVSMAGVTVIGLEHLPAWVKGRKSQDQVPAGLMPLIEVERQLLRLGL